MAEPGSPARRLLWFVALYAAGIAATGALALVIRAMLRP